MGGELAALERVLARSAQVATEEILAQVRIETGATSAVLFVERQGELRLKGGVSVDQECLDRVHAFRAMSGGEFGPGHPHWCQTWCLWPCATPHGLATLYLAGPALHQARVRQAIDGMARLLGLLASDGLDRVDAVLQQAANEQIARDRLTTLLQESEWNIALAARTQGVTRVTLYKWMRRLGIERMKIRRSLAIARRPAATGR
jgi:hypothetical protein